MFFKSTFDSYIEIIFILDARGYLELENVDVVFTRSGNQVTVYFTDGNEKHCMTCECTS